MTALKKTLFRLTVLMALCTPVVAADKMADVIYYGGPIVTMICDGDRVEAIAIGDGKILATGRTDDVMGFKGEGTKLVDLAGRCLMPGFIDSHSHFALQSAKFSTVNLDPVPIGDVKNIADIQHKLKEYIETKKPKPGQWIYGWGYDDTGLEEMRHPNRDDLDAVTTENPIALIHISTHFAAGNSKALEMAGITAETPDPDGGLYQRRSGSQEPSGVMEETAFMEFISKAAPPSKEKALEMFKNGLDYYAAVGITTVCEGASSAGIMELLRKLEKENALTIDVVSYPMYKVVTDDVIKDVVANWKKTAPFRPGGIKMILDGSIQGFTAFLSEPYYKQIDKEVYASGCDHDAVDKLFISDDMPASSVVHHHEEEEAQTSGNRGYPSMSLEQVTHWVQVCSDNNIPFHAHCNGDAAIDILLEAMGSVYGDRPRPELRNVIIHSQTIRDDQLNAAVSHGLIPSFFPIHVYFWGDRHREIFLGPERAARINPARSALDRGLKITLHHDAPVAGIGMLPIVDAAVNRITSSGEPLGLEERITPYEALRAITKDAAYQYFEEHRKGTLEPDKLADMIILDADPLAVNPQTIGSIKVLETIKEGHIVFSAAAN